MRVINFIYTATCAAVLFLAANAHTMAWIMDGGTP